MDNKLISVLNQLSIQNIGNTNSQWVSFSCPIAKNQAAHGFKDDNNPSAGATLGSDGVYYWHCFCCGAKGTLSKLVTTLGKQRRMSYANILSELSTGKYYEDFDSIAYKGTEVGETITTPLYIYKTVFDDIDDEALSYLTNRGIKPSTIGALNIKYSKMRKRIIFPYITKVNNTENTVLNYEVVGYSGRSILPNPKRKILNSHFNKKEYLLGEHLWTGKPLVIVEGLFAYARAWQVLSNDYDIAALSGVTASPTQLAKIIAHDTPITLFLDGDPPGIIGAKALNNSLKSEVYTTIVNYTDKNDIDVLTDEEIFSIVRSAKKLV